MSDTKARLVLLAASLTHMVDNYQIRSEGEVRFSQARNELADIIATYTEAEVPPPPVPVIEQVIMLPAQVEALIDGVVARMPPATDAEAIVTAITEHIEQSDVAIMSAIATLTPAQQ